MLPPLFQNLQFFQRLHRIRALLFLQGWEGFVEKEHKLHTHTVPVRHVGVSSANPFQALRCSEVTILRTKSNTHQKSHTALSFHLMAALDGDGVFKTTILLDLSESDPTNVYSTSDRNRESCVFLCVYELYVSEVGPDFLCQIKG